MDSDASPKRRWVCGKETTQVCSKCAAAGVEIQLCSRECQKLVWYGHKHVCGSKPGHFDPPDFDEEEAERLKHIFVVKNARGRHTMSTCSPNT
ncbi:hypothetical protein JCM8547_000518 [Rhodosporidiobolus lusitaniae]